MPTIIDLGQQVKQKYPGIYDDLSDLEIGQKVKVKYPGSYDDFTDIQQQTEQPKSIFRKTGEFLGEATGITGVAKGVRGATQVALGKPLTVDTSPKRFLGSAGKAALTASIPFTGGLTAGIRGGIGVVARAGESGIIGATYQALSNLENKQRIAQGLGMGAAIGAAIPVSGATIAGAKKLFGKGLQAGGEKIQTSIIKPSRADVEDGFSIANINKYKLGGSLQQMAQKTENKITELAQALSSKIKSTDAKIDIKQIAQKTKNELLKDKTRLFGNIAGSRRAVEALMGEVEEISTRGLLGLDEAQVVKQAAGQKGAWVFGNADPDARAIEKVYTAFYRNLRKEIEQKAPQGIREINKRLSDLIPIQNAIIRRIPVAERANIIGLPELVGLGGAFFSPYSLSIIAANKLAKSGLVGSVLARLGERIAKTTPPKTRVGERIFGR